MAEDSSCLKDSFIQLPRAEGLEDGFPEVTPEQVRREIEHCKVRPAVSVRGGSGQIQTAPGPAPAGPGCELEFLIFSWTTS